MVDVMSFVMNVVVVVLLGVVCLFLIWLCFFIILNVYPEFLKLGCQSHVLKK